MRSVAPTGAHGTVADMTYELTGLAGKVAVVTGAGRMRSIGRPIAVALAQAGCDVVLTGTGRAPDRYPEDEKQAGWRDIESVADEVRAHGRRALTAVSDVSDHDAVEKLAGRVVSELGRCDFVINNAGAARGDDRVPVVDLPFDTWKHIIEVNLHGTFAMSQMFGRVLLRQGHGGAIVNISSIAGRVASANTAAYSASKAAIHALTSAMAKEVGPNGIRVNSILPGLIDTSRMEDMRANGLLDQAAQTLIPLRRTGTGDDVAAMAVFLCSDQGNWVTGQQIIVDGGHTSIAI